MLTSVKRAIPPGMRRAIRRLIDAALNAPRRVADGAKILTRAALGIGEFDPKDEVLTWKRPVAKVRRAAVRKVQTHMESVGSQRRRAAFIQRLDGLFLQAERQRGEAIASRLPTVVLAIGTVGPGGSERQVVNTALALSAQRQFRPVVACSNLGGGASEFHRTTLDKAGIEVIDLKALDMDGVAPEHASFIETCRVELANSGFNISDHVVRFLAAFLKERPSIVHSFLDDTNVKAGIAAVLAQVPRVVLSMRSVAPINFSLHTPFMQPGYESLLKRPETVLCCNSNAGAADYRRWLSRPELPIHIVENGIDFDQFAPSPDHGAADRAKHGLPEGTPVLGSIMRLTEEKQPLLWARAVIEISRQIPDMHFVLVGDGPLKNEVSQLVTAAGIDHRTHLLGHIKDIPSVLRCLDLLLLTSRLEGLPNVLIEAQAMGVPVVTTPAGGAAEALNHGRTGLVAPDQTVFGVAETCLRILSDPTLRAEFSRQAPQFVRDKFSVERMLNRTLQLYR